MYPETEFQFDHIWIALDYLLDRHDITQLKTLCGGLIGLKSKYDGVNFLPDFYSRRWASDCFVLLEDYNVAIEFFPSIEIGGRASASADALVSLKLAAQQRIGAQEILALCGPKVTKFGKENINLIAKYIQTILDTENDQTHLDRLREWASHSYRYNYQVFIGLAARYGYLLTTQKVKIKAYSFSNNPDVASYVRLLTRQAENTVREERGIPRIGEGWVSETQLYYEIKNHFPNFEITLHYSPDWLGRQHLDIFIYELNVALEYQGIQHDRPVDFFGGQQAFEAIQKRDIRKLRLCRKHGIKLIYVREGYIIEDILREISSQ